MSMQRVTCGIKLFSFFDSKQYKPYKICTCSISSTLKSRLVETNAGYITDRGSRECWRPREWPEIIQMLPNQV